MARTAPPAKYDAFALDIVVQQLCVGHGGLPGGADGFRQCAIIMVNEWLSSDLMAFSCSITRAMKCDVGSTRLGPPK
jgi:hypothetical protein